MPCQALEARWRAITSLWQYMRNESLFSHTRHGSPWIWLIACGCRSRHCPCPPHGSGGLEVLPRPHSCSAWSPARWALQQQKRSLLPPITACFSSRSTRDGGSNLERTLVRRPLDLTTAAGNRWTFRMTGALSPARAPLSTTRTRQRGRAWVTSAGESGGTASISRWKRAMPARRSTSSLTESSRLWALSASLPSFSRPASCARVGRPR